MICTYDIFSLKNPPLLEPPLLAGCNKDESDQKSAANIYKSVHITSRRRKLDSIWYMIEKSNMTQLNLR